MILSLNILSDICRYFNFKILSSDEISYLNDHNKNARYFVLF